ncbi:SMU1112c/YaeR family gloxylase I-like metalloprotein [Sinomicrobium weinanense]|uniref:VOC family protein n=1 Tax=Sinomicrobium weinanense TaxID=2842200 RepID=A0A926Q4J8_9FLAO|nr:VOC family protein [Sinomicrobium weinanense]MBU3124866.1 VOC family protein [Sinomicrobium weinanense]
MLRLNKIHHIALICSDYKKSKAFYTELLGFTILKETYRTERDSYKLDLALNGTYTLELFSFPDPPPRVSGPEAAGLRHLAFETDDLEMAVATLREKGVRTEDIRTDGITGKRFVFFRDPDDLPLELYEN